MEATPLFVPSGDEESPEEGPVPQRQKWAGGRIAVLALCAVAATIAGAVALSAHRRRVESTQAESLAAGAPFRSAATSPTVVPAEDFMAEMDSEELRGAMRGLGTDEDTITGIIARRTRQQLQDVVEQYGEMFQRSLREDLESELGGDFQKVVLARTYLEPTFLAIELRQAMEGLGTNEATLIQILPALPSAGVQSVKEAYKQRYHRDLESDCKDETSGSFRTLVTFWLQGRAETTDVDLAKATASAQALHDEGEGTWGTDWSRFTLILSKESFPQLRAIFEEYTKISQKDILSSMKSQMSGDLEDGFSAVISLALSPAAHFAKLLDQAMKGWGTDEATLTRVLAWRSEIDLGEIKEAYEEAYGKTLSDAIRDDCSGDYLDFLLELVGQD